MTVHINPKNFNMGPGEMIYEIARRMPDDHVIRVETEFDAGDLRISRHKVNTLLELDMNEGQIHFVVIDLRPGAKLFCSHLEYTHFNPLRPEINKLFEFRYLKWRGHLWRVVSIPADKKNKAEESAKHAGLKIKHTIPFIAGMMCAAHTNKGFQDLKKQIGGDGLKQFPMNSKNVYTLEGQASSRLTYDAEQEKLKELYDTTLGTEKTN